LPLELFNELEQSAVQGNTARAAQLVAGARSRDAAVADALVVLVADFAYAKVLELLPTGKGNKK